MDVRSLFWEQRGAGVEGSGGESGRGWLRHGSEEWASGMSNASAGARGENASQADGVSDVSEGGGMTEPVCVSDDGSVAAKG